MYGNVHFSTGPDPDNIARMDHNCLPMIHRMEQVGIRVDLPFLRDLDSRILTQQLEVESTIRGELGNYQDFNGKKYQPLNIDSPDQLARLLFQHLQVQGDEPLDMTKTGKREVVDDDVLARFASVPIVANIREYSKLGTLRSTYTMPLQLHADSDSRIHTSFNVTVAATGRLSSSAPNLQNIPVRTEMGKEIRKAFTASPGRVLVSGDLSQIEMRWAAHRSKDPTMMGVFFRDEDVHTRTTCNIFGLDYETMMALAKLVEAGLASEAQQKEYKYFKNFQRLPCKNVGFGVLYGQTAEGLQASLAADGVYWTLEDCEEFITKKFFSVYAMLKDMLERDYAYVKRYGMICDDFGRVRLVPEAKSFHQWIVSEGVRKAGNHPEQSGAQGTIKLAMAELYPIMENIHRDTYCEPLLQIHDELISEVDPVIAREFAQVKQSILENASPLDVPIRSSADIAERWGDLK